MKGNKLTVTTFIVAGILLSLLAAQKLILNKSGNANPERNLRAEEADKLITENKDNPDFFLLDVRTPAEFNKERIENSINLNYGSSGFRDSLATYDTLKTYLLYCRSGNRSRFALNIMEDLGFKHIFHVSGGIKAWKKAEFKTVN